MKSLQRPTSWIFTFDESAAEDGGTAESESAAEESLEIPEDLTSVTDDSQLGTWETELLATFDAIRGGTEQLSQDNIEELATIKTAVERIRAERTRRDTERQELAAKAEAMAAELNKTEEPEAAEAEEEGGNEGEAENEAEQPAGTETAATQEQVTASNTPGSLVIKRPKLNVPLSEVQRRAPDPGVSGQQEASVIVAPDVPNYTAGRYLSDMENLTDAMHRRAKTLSLPSGRATVATIKREFDVVLDREANPEKIWDIMRRAGDPQNLVAAGGWCAPSEIIYDFFNISAEDGILDVPTVGVQRGGIRFPQSPSIADIFADSNSVWLWTEANDEAAATNGPSKPCVRIPCPDFDEERLDCHGICVTAGNLTDSAFPELIQNHLQLTMAAHRHVINERHIADIVALAETVDVTGGNGTTDCSIALDLLEFIDLQAYDYREKFRMTEDAVLELILPRWAKGALRSDIAKRTGQNEMAVTNAQIGEWFDVRSVRVQYVSDWQLGAGLIGGSTPATSWPDAMEFLLYAAGTVVVGAGLDLDLGVVRDSTLNEKNDHTAAWTEECFLVAKIGHEIRHVLVPLCTGGCTGSHVDFCGVSA